MAKRKRLSPATVTQGFDGPAPETKSMLRLSGPARAPIADVSHDAATQSAFEEVAAELQAIRREGRLIAALPLTAIDDTHLVRDRVQVDEADMATLTDSLRSRGQQTPIEVVDLGGGRYGLISGWRRLMALRALQAETGVNHVQALIRQPETASDAYQAMVEENEIRAGLSFYERARIAVQAAKQGIYPDTQKAVQGLFAAARAPKRSKIATFTTLVGALDDHLRFPAAIPEKLGLALVKALNENSGVRRRVVEALRKAAPQTAEAERRVLERVLRPVTPPAKPLAKSPTESPAEAIGEASMSAPSAEVALHQIRGGVKLVGKGVTADLIADLQAWLHARS